MNDCTCSYFNTHETPITVNLKDFCNWCKVHNPSVVTYTNRLKEAFFFGFELSFEGYNGELICKDPYSMHPYVVKDILLRSIEISNTSFDDSFLTKSFSKLLEYQNEYPN